MINPDLEVLSITPPAAPTETAPPSETLVESPLTEWWRKLMIEGTIRKIVKLEVVVEIHKLLRHFDAGETVTEDMVPKLLRGVINPTLLRNRGLDIVASSQDPNSGISLSTDIQADSLNQWWEALLKKGIIHKILSSQVWKEIHMLLTKIDAGNSIQLDEIPDVIKRIVKPNLLENRGSSVATSLNETMTGQPQPSDSAANTIVKAVETGVEATVNEMILGHVRMILRKKENQRHQDDFGLDADGRRLFNGGQFRLNDQYYTLRGCIGRGKTAVVVKAEDTNGNPFVVKLVPFANQHNILKNWDDSQAVDAIHALNSEIAVYDQASQKETMGANPRLLQQETYVIDRSGLPVSPNSLTVSTNNFDYDLRRNDEWFNNYLFLPYLDFQQLATGEELLKALPKDISGITQYLALYAYMCDALYSIFGEEMTADPQISNLIVDVNGKMKYIDLSKGVREMQAMVQKYEEDKERGYTWIKFKEDEPFVYALSYLQYILVRQLALNFANVVPGIYEVILTTINQDPANSFIKNRLMIKTNREKLGKAAASANVDQVSPEVRELLINLCRGSYQSLDDLRRDLMKISGLKPIQDTY